MRVWTCSDHDGFWPVGTASVIVANTEGEARDMLAEALRVMGLDPDRGFTLQEVPLDGYRVIVLNDGNY